MPPKRRRVLSDDGQEQHKADASKMKDNPSSEQKSSLLLTLPPELRLMIYEYAVVEEVAITITKHTRLPDLLSVCAAIRHEAFPIWFKGNKFRITITDCDASLLRALLMCYMRSTFMTSSKTLRDVDVLIYAVGFNWRNLRQWLFWVYQGECVGLVWPRSTDVSTEEVIVICGATDVVVDGASWEACKRILDGYNKTVCFLSSKIWEDD